MEVIVALTIFLISMAAIGMLVDMALSRSADARLQTMAMQLCQAKIAEFAAGVESLDTPQNEVVYDFDPQWSWTATLDGAGLDGLHKVQVRVQRNVGTPPIEAVLTQFVFDPRLRGTTQGATVTAPVKTKSAATGKKTGG